MRNLMRSGAKFLVVGAISTVIELTLFNFFVVILRWDPVPAKIASSLIALVNAYIGNRQWAFRDRRGRGRLDEALLFAVVNGGCMALGVTIVALGAAALGSPGPLALNVINALSIGTVVVIRFALYRLVVFRAIRDATTDRQSETHHLDTVSSTRP